MKLRTVLCDKTNSAGCFQKHPLLHLAAISLLAAQVVPNIVWAQAQPAPPLSGVLGKVQSFAGSSLDVATRPRYRHAAPRNLQAETDGCEPCRLKLLCHKFSRIPTIQQKSAQVRFRCAV